MGKSHLLKKIQQGKYTLLRKQLGIIDPGAWRYVEAVDLEGISQSNIERLILHYDSYGQYSQKEGFKYLHNLITSSNKVTVLTLLSEHGILMRRLEKRIISFSFFLLFGQKNIPRIRNLKRKRKIYKDGHHVAGAASTMV